MNAAIDILIQKLSSGGDSAEHAADALIDQARRHGAKLDSEVAQLAPHLSHRNFSVRAAVSRVLGEIGTTKAVDTIVTGLMSTPEHELNKECGFSCWSEEPLHYWFVSSIGETQNEHTAQVLVSLINSPRLSKAAKSSAMKHLSYYDLDEYDVALPENIVDVLAEFASSSDSDVAEGAIRLLGKV